MSLGLPESSFVVLKIERATLIYVAVCDPDDSQGPVLEGGSRLFQHHSFSLWKLCALAIQEAPLILLGHIFSFPVPNRKDCTRKETYCPKLAPCLLCYVVCPNVCDQPPRFLPAALSFTWLRRHTPCSPSGLDLKLRPAIIRTAPCMPSTT
jgi:hypothetical protein